jgi:hypothetical protein
VAVYHLVAEASHTNINTHTHTHTHTQMPRQVVYVAVYYLVAEASHIYTYAHIHTNIHTHIHTQMPRQVVYVAVYHLVAESSHLDNNYPLTLGPYEWYLIIHGFGGLLYETGQIMQEGVISYCTDPWNVIDICMYAFLSLWLIFRISEAVTAPPEPDLNDDGPLGPVDDVIVQFVNDTVTNVTNSTIEGMFQFVNDALDYRRKGGGGGSSYNPVDDVTELVNNTLTPGVEREVSQFIISSSDYLGLAGIFIWVRLLNVFGLDPTFGPLVLIIQGMCKQVVVFLILLTVFLAGFGACMR